MENDSKHSKSDDVRLDSTDLKIIAAKADDPTASSRDVGKRVGLSHTAVQTRLRKLDHSPAFEEVRRGIADLLPQSKIVYSDTLTGSDPALRLSAARDVFKGLGIFKDHSKSEQSSIPVTPEQLVEAILALDDDGYAEFTSIFDERLREIRDSIVSAQPDPAPAVISQEPTPDA